MLAADEDALVCDLAETYQITDWRALPVQTVAALAGGLSPDSRIKRKITDAPASTSELLMAAMVDRLSLLAWGQTTDAMKGKNRPKMLMDLLTKDKGQAAGDVEAYDTPEAFEAARRRIMEGGGNGGH